MDNDGDPDLFIANLGSNALYSNNGDGTFTQVDLPEQLAGNVWSSGCGWGDLNGDGFNDVYVVNYLGGPEVFTRACTHNGKPAQCHPRLFPGEQDQLLINDGAGGFRDETALIRTTNGKGLGLVMADLDGDADMDVFVSNDSVANFAFRNQLADSGVFGLNEDALLMGLAFDERGWEQACMGVAAADANNDGLLDLFVTNFYREANTLYKQATPGVFVDATRAAHLRDPSWLTMGWGTQFIDFELDGEMDLVIANGHLNDLRDEDKAYQMPTELHVNTGGRFQMVAADALSEYFQRAHLGRSVARWDFNRDGREEFCVTHVDQPVAILVNETPPAGKSLAVQLAAVGSAARCVWNRRRGPLRRPGVSPPTHVRQRIRRRKSTAIGRRSGGRGPSQRAHDSLAVRVHRHLPRCGRGKTSSLHRGQAGSDRTALTRRSSSRSKRCRQRQQIRVGRTRKRCRTPLIQRRSTARSWTWRRTTRRPFFVNWPRRFFITEMRCGRSCAWPPSRAITSNSPRPPIASKAPWP